METKKIISSASPLQFPCFALRSPLRRSQSDRINDQACAHGAHSQAVGENSEIPQNAKNNLGTHPQALIRHFEQIIGHDNAIDAPEIAKPTSKSLDCFFAVYFHGGPRFWTPWPWFLQQTTKSHICKDVRQKINDRAPSNECFSNFHAIYGAQKRGLQALQGPPDRVYSCSLSEINFPIPH